MKKYIFPLILASVIALPMPCNAAPIINLSAAEAQGKRGRIPLIGMELNRGMHIKVEGQRIYKGWLDNSIAELDSDRPFDQGAQIIFLVPRRSGVTKLSMVARDPQGEERLYVLRLKTGIAAPDIVAIAPPSVGAGSPTATASVQLDRVVHSLRSGVKAAIDQRILIAGSPLWQAVNRFLGLVEQGHSVQDAAQKAGVALQVVTKLLNLAEPQQLPQPVPDIPPSLLPGDGGLIIKLPDEPEFSFDPAVSVDIGAVADMESLLAALANKSDQPDAPPVSEVIPKQVPEKVPEKAPEPQKAPRVAKKPKPSSHEIANALIRGLVVARHEGQIGYQTSMWRRVQDVVWLARQGRKLADACWLSQVPLSVAHQLLEWGGVDVSLLETADDA